MWYPCPGLRSASSERWACLRARRMRSAPWRRFLFGVATWGPGMRSLRGQAPAGRQRTRDFRSIWTGHRCAMWFMSYGALGAAGHASGCSVELRGMLCVVIRRSSLRRVGSLAPHAPPNFVGSEWRGRDCRLERGGRLSRLLVIPSHGIICLVLSGMSFYDALRLRQCPHLLTPRASLLIIPDLKVSPIIAFATQQSLSDRLGVFTVSRGLRLLTLG